MRILSGLYDIAKISAFGPPKPLGVSIDISNRCNLRCKHCYFFREGYSSELSDEEWLNRINALKDKYKTLLQASWCGGEPLLREKLIENGMKMFKYNLVVTNGTLPLPNWPNCVFEVSVDGTKEFHDNVRGNGTYAIIKENISQKKDIIVNLACIINRLNYHSLEAMIKEWAETSVRGIHFGFYSPTKTDPISELYVSHQLRDEIIDSIKYLKKSYGKFILTTEKVLDLMRSENCDKVTTNCPFKDLIICLGTNGVEKECPVGSEANCIECGHSPPFFMTAIKMRDFETIRFLFRETINIGV